MQNMQKGVYISTYGCQMNVNDTERMYSLLEMSNYTPVNSPDQAELIIINSCSVREKPVHKVSSEVGRYRDLKTKNPKLRIGVGGCVAQQEKKNLLADIPLLDFVFGTDNIDTLPQLVSDVAASEDKMVSARFEYTKPYQIETMIRNPGVSTFVNITKGCDNFCTFCVVPYTRGRERSRPMQELIKDIQALGKRGVHEVTLLGQNVNSYTSDCGANFGTLLKTLATDTDIKRIRYTTSHPKDFNQELVDISQAYREKICDYIHLPVQSGNSEVLERMNRGYTRESYLEKVDMIRKAIPGVALSTDIIVGFPGETEEQFQDTLSLVQEVGYDNIYAFKYSPRPFTKAARWTDQLSDEDKSERLERLFALQRPISLKRSEECMGKEYDVLVEEFKENNMVRGRTSSNRPVIFQKEGAELGGVYRVRVTKTRPSLMEAILV
ncbi:MAG: tRNA (N6-isopentenyl adenosine(37)-C2)-methylthiotransferase MiaB [Bdellovibrionaceae bacterium]|nr:tRNA (N6-isopentenyl adenosine(37)-C2)-methylthiotransferase MiaB [Pseudobdellovibrionaceae bacterium]